MQFLKFFLVVEPQPGTLLIKMHKNTGPQPFILLSSQRTGSAFLEQCLNSNKEIHCSGEILLGYGGSYNKLPPKLFLKHRRFRTLWQALFSGAAFFPIKSIENTWKINPDVEHIGFRLMYNQIQRDFRVKKYIKNLNNVNIIHLKRKNLLKQFVSLKLMHNQSKYGRHSAHVTKRPPLVSIKINHKEAIKYIETILLQRKNSLKLVNHLNILSINYEDMIGSKGLNNDISNKISSFFQINDQSYASNQVKMNSSNLKNLITNYDELEEVFKKSSYAELLND